jgi:hypothetical protein
LLAGWFYAFNLRKSDFLGTVDGNVPKNKSGEFERTREKSRRKIDRNFLENFFSRENSSEIWRKTILEKNPVKTGENHMVNTHYISLHGIQRKKINISNSIFVQSNPTLLMSTNYIV